ncbi:MAG TPA: DUF1702 family protein [Ktedonosporobacter sp.]|nr:DUF1702 family protein [Ktedonosporobacter sp.]
MFFSSNWSRRLRRSLFGIPLEETTFAKRGFLAGEIGAQQRLEQIGTIFVQGYHAALEEDHFEVLTPALQSIDSELQGFAFEGAAMGLALLDYVLPIKRRLTAFMQGPGAEHIYMVHVGAGWTLGRIPRNARKFRQQFDPLLNWLVLDGYGFHQGFFAWNRFIGEQVQPAHLRGYELRAFDQGLGRSLWFVKGADAHQVSSTIETFPSARRGDLWSGVGLACTYAGGVERDVIEELYYDAGAYRSHLAQGSAFAAKARQRAGNPTASTDLACKVLTGCSSAEAARICDECLKDLSLEEQSYEHWRLRIRMRLAELPQEARQDERV